MTFIEVWKLSMLSVENSYLAMWFGLVWNLIFVGNWFKWISFAHINWVTTCFIICLNLVDIWKWIYLFLMTFIVMKKLRKIFEKMWCKYCILFLLEWIEWTHSSQMGVLGVCFGTCTYLRSCPYRGPKLVRVLCFEYFW